jgi:4-hydroxy-2-oxoheptanedioate aldolase
MRKNKLKEIFKAGKSIINSWLDVPSLFSTEMVDNQELDSLTIEKFQSCRV